MSLNVENLNKVIARIERVAPHEVRMSLFADGKISEHSCGTAGCIAGWSMVCRDGYYNPYKYIGSVFAAAGDFLGMNSPNRRGLFAPSGYGNDKLYPKSRVLRTLYRLRDHYLVTGQIVIDWGPEPGKEPARSWSAPQVAEIPAPALPAELTDLLRGGGQAVPALVGE